jgi:hypothetical protein
MRSDRMRKRCGWVAIGVLLVASAAAQAAPDAAVLKLTNGGCAGGGASLTVDAKAQAFLVDATGLTLSKQPKELIIMRKPVKFFRLPWIVGRTSYEVSPATAKPVFRQDALFPLQAGERITIGVMSPTDEVIVSCDAQVR